MALVAGEPLESLQSSCSPHRLGVHISAIALLVRLSVCLSSLLLVDVFIVVGLSRLEEAHGLGEHVLVSARAAIVVGYIDGLMLVGVAEELGCQPTDTA